MVRVGHPVPVAARSPDGFAAPAGTPRCRGPHRLAATNRRPPPRWSASTSIQHVSRLSGAARSAQRGPVAGLASWPAGRGEHRPQL